MKPIINKKEIFSQIIIAVLTGLTMMVVGLIWIRFGATAIFFNQSFLSFLNLIAFKNNFISVIEMTIFLSAISYLILYININRLIAISVFFLLFPMIWILTSGAIFYGNELLYAIDRYDRFGSLGFDIFYYGGLVLIPAVITWLYYRRRCVGKMAEFITLNIFYICMNLLFYTPLVFLTLGCVYFNSCV